MTDNLSIAVHAFDRCILMSFSVDEMLLYESHIFTYDIFVGNGHGNQGSNLERG